ncbi:MAG TPA: beta-galactosidase [Pyrinomonadaceae bacterium]|jgi:beta-galactosidase|nr:beta-galactosidase [Pyrinomonadaceae bacterium]
MTGKLGRALSCCLMLLLPAAAGAAEPERPRLGAQVWVEPGQTEQDLDRWFKTLADSHMPVARLFLMWNYLEAEPGRWDFRLYDAAFRAAERHGVRVVATLTPNHGPAHRGYTYSTQGGAITTTEERLREADDYVARVVNRYRTSPALDSWMLMNEPGQRAAADPLALARYRPWLKEKYGTAAKLDAAWNTSFTSFDEIAYDPRWSAGGFGFAAPAAFTDWQTFWRGHLAWYLSRTAGVVRRLDPAHRVHVNPHALVGNLSNNSLDLPAWRPFLDSLGASIHPSWHFGLLGREQFALGVSWVCDLVRGASEPKPFWVTELQGGGQLYSAARPLTPDERDIAQWVWTSVGAGADRVIFWLLNARGAGGEAGEWSMLDFGGGVTLRLEEASVIARVIERNADLFARARPVESRVTILLSLETMTLQERFRAEDFAGRDRDAHVLEALGFYRALSELGIPASLKHAHDFDWRGDARGPQLLILPHASVLTAAQASGVEGFVRRGNTVVATGLTAAYDAEGRFLPLKRWPLAGVAGATLIDFRVVGERGEVALTDPPVKLPTHFVEGDIGAPSQEVVVGTGYARQTASRRKTGAGEFVWVPSLVGLGAWRGDGAPLARWLETIAKPFAREAPFGFEGRQPDCLMRQMRGGEGEFVTVITNGAGQPRTCRLRKPEGLVPARLWGDALAGDGRNISLGARATSVLQWKRAA